MQINSASIAAMTTGFQAQLQRGLLTPSVTSKIVAMETSSKTKQETYNFLKSMPVLKGTAE
ncbi:MAG: Mu-like prophage major head subunit gpT family protein [Alphaproteobacteria bacterium]|nr:Mu-like prophage major head subunit gpT family protein [Alphaproteobacteria bacterium]